jgi:hypothetical protein
MMIHILEPTHLSISSAEIWSATRSASLEKLEVEEWNIPRGRSWDAMAGGFDVSIGERQKRIVVR